MWRSRVMGFEVAIVGDPVAAASLFRTVTRQLSGDQGKHVAGFGHDVNVPDDRAIGEYR
jgi:hypothetical protein